MENFNIGTNTAPLGEEGFNILTELEEWSSQLEIWQQCALAKLVSQSTLSEADMDIVFREFLWDRGLVPAPSSRNKYPIEAAESTTYDSPVIRIKAINNVTGVNALTPNQQLEISPQLTVVYGPNGSGKSGYARILKASCFTRSKKLSILGNINLVDSDRAPISAAFAMADGTTEYVKPGEQNKVLRDNFAVFDSSCIRVHTDERKTFVVTPFLFDVFPRLAEVIANVNERFKALKRTYEFDQTTLRIPDGKSRVAELLNSMSASTERASIIELATVSEQDERRTLQLVHEIELLKKSDPVELIKKKQGALVDLQALSRKLKTAIDSLSIDATSAISVVISELQGLRNQACLLSDSAFAHEPLQGTGSAAWRDLLVAALAYNAEAYPGHGFPADQPGTMCLLCQQPLQDDAKDRLRRFQQFMTSDLERRINASRGKLDTLSTGIAGVDLSVFSIDSVLRRTADQLAPELSPEVDRLLAILQSRKDIVQSAVRTESMFSIPDAATSAFKQISALQEKLSEEIVTLNAKDTAQIIKQFQDELTLLQERKILSERLEYVLSALEKLVWLNAANKTPLPTAKVVTQRQKLLMTKLVATGFREKFLLNCAQLDVNLPLDFKIRGAEGETDRQLGFNTAGGNETSLSDVLSEGEQTAVALADFLTEIGLEERPVGLVFDDPVTSMDHMRKELIAKRLVQEAKNRQVIIFTHDILFSHHLANEAAAQGHTFTFFGRTVSKNQDGDIGCIDYLVFPHTHYEGEALDKAESHLAAAKSLTGAAQRDYLEKGCGSLRTAYEDFIQKQLFADVVRRWRENILFKLSSVYIPDEIGPEVDTRMGMLSRYIDAHSHSASYHEVPLTVDILSSEIVQYKDIIARYRTAKKTWDKMKTKGNFA